VSADRSKSSPPDPVTNSVGEAAARRLVVSRLPLASTLKSTCSTPDHNLAANLVFGLVYVHSDCPVLTLLRSVEWL
jgi:hypothetical protein